MTKDFGSLDRAVSHVLSDSLSQTVDYQYGEAHRLEGEIFQPGSSFLLSGASDPTSSTPSGCSEEGLQDGGHRSDRTLMKKRLREEDQTNKGEAQPQRKTTSTGAGASQQEIRSFACPFIKYDPSTYKVIRTCSGSRFRTVTRVK